MADRPNREAAIYLREPTEQALDLGKLPAEPNPYPYANLGVKPVCGHLRAVQTLFYGE